MKPLFVILLLGTLEALSAQPDAYYHYYFENKKVLLEYDVTRVTLLLDKGIDEAALQGEIWLLAEDATLKLVKSEPFWVYSEKDKLQPNLVELHLEKERSKDEYKELMDRLRGIPELGVVQANYISTRTQSKIGTTRRILALLREVKDTMNLSGIAERHKLTYHGNGLGLDGWAEFSYDSREDAFEVANRMLEGSNDFLSCQPVIFGPYKLNCNNPPNDFRFPLQWGLNNTGTRPEIDIKFCEARDEFALINKGMGAGIKIGMIDDGLSPSHPDLNPNLMLPGFNVSTQITSPATSGVHGTLCAGIMCAITNNDLNGPSTGIAGIASKAELLPFSVVFQTQTTDQELARALNRAKDENVDVINNSWGGGDFDNNIMAAIRNLLTNGRNNLGTVVVFSSGNKSEPNGEFPSNVEPDIISVGGVDRCGFRSARADVVPGSCEPWGANEDPGSSYGTRLDLVGPGTQVHTLSTNPNLQTSSIAVNGTSFAAPHASAIAALILSLNPCLTQKQVGDIMERSAQRIDLPPPSPSRVYSTTVGRPNGPWNNEVGSGLLNAYDAIRLTQTLFVQNRTITSQGILFANPTGEVWAGENVDFSRPNEQGMVNIAPTANVTFKSGKRILLKKGFRVNAGARFRASIDPNFNGCNGWTSTRLAPEITDEQAEPLEDLSMRKVATSSYSGLSLFPNPNNGRFSLSYQRHDEAHKGGIAIQVSNSLGQLVFVQHLDAGGDTANLDIQLDQVNLKSGIYFLQLHEGNLSANLKFVVHEN